MIGKLLDWMLSPLTRRVRREVEAAMAKCREADRRGQYELAKRMARKEDSCMPIRY